MIMGEYRHASAHTDCMHGLYRGATLKLATWHCGGLSFTQRDYIICAQLGYDILALTETHDKGGLRPNKHYLTGDAVSGKDPCSGVTMPLSDRVADSVLRSGCLGSCIVFARIRASPCNLFVVCVYVSHGGRQNPSSTDTLVDLEALLTNVPQHDCTIVLGDFNAKQRSSNGQMAHPQQIEHAAGIMSSM